MDLVQVEATVVLLACAEPEGVGDRGLVDLLRGVEELKAAAAGLQARAAAVLVAREHGRRGGGAAASTGRSVGAQVGLARRESPHRGRELVSFGSRLVTDLPHTLEALMFGRVSERRAMIIAAELADASTEHRALIDERLCAVPGVLDGLGDLGVRYAVRREVYRLDRGAVLARRERAGRGRSVSCRRDWGQQMAGISGWVEDTAAAAIMTSLSQAAARVIAARDAAEAGDPEDVRSRGQVMADLFVSRLTSQPTAGAVPVAVKLVVSAETLLGDDDAPGEVEHIGPVPAAVARRLVAASPEVGSTIQRLFRFPGTASLVAMESTARCFTGQLRGFIGVRDQWRCRSPWCGAPAVQIDHPVPVREGGPTSAVNGQGDCVGCNLAKEHPGWRHRPVTGEADPRPHEIEITSPTGHIYHSRAPALPPEPRGYDPPLEVHWAGCAHPA